MQLEKINSEAIKSIMLNGYTLDGEKFVKLLANKINEIIDVLNEKKKENWEKEFDEEFG